MDEIYNIPTESVSAVSHVFKVTVDPTVALDGYAEGLFDRMVERAPRMVERAGLTSDSLVQYLRFLTYTRIAQTEGKVRGMTERQFLLAPAFFKNRVNTLGKYAIVKPDFIFAPSMEKVEMTPDLAFETSERLSVMRNVIELDDHAFDTSSRNGQPETMTKCLHDGHVLSIYDTPGDAEVTATLFGLKYEVDDWWVNRYEFSQSRVDRIQFSIMNRDGYYGIIPTRSI